jgi:hypothetical protein
MRGVRQHPSDSRTVADELVRDDEPRLVRTAVQDASQEAFGGLLVPSLLDQASPHDSGLVDGPPQPVTLAAELEPQLVEVPLCRRGELVVGRARPRTLDPTGVHPWRSAAWLTMLPRSASRS